MNHAVRGKIVSLEELQAVVTAARRKAHTVALCHGCFDIVHPGHVRYLEFARSRADVLIVSVTGDTAVAKGAQRPYIPQELRAENLAALVFVDYVYIDPNPTAEHTLSVVRPDAYIKGAEYENSADPRFIREKSIVEQYGGRVIYSSGDVVFSSTRLQRSILADADAENLALSRLRIVCERYGIHAPALHQVLTACRALRVLVLGDLILDRYVLCDTLGVASESPMMSLTHLDEQQFVGGAGIVARHAAALGADVALLTSLGDDHASAFCRETLEHDGIEIHPVGRRPAIVEKTRYLSDDRKLFKLDRGRRTPADSEAERRAAAVIERHARFADVAILCDFGYGVISHGLLARVLPVLRHHVRIIAADVSGDRGHLMAYKNVDLLTPTEREVRAVMNDYDSGLSAAAWNLMHATNARHLLITLEKRGVVLFERRSHRPDTPEWSDRLLSEHFPSFAKQPVDTLGCGDALLTTSALALAAGASLAQAAYLGSAAAAIEADVPGNAPVTRETLLAWLSHRHELIQPAPIPPAPNAPIENPCESCTPDLQPASPSDDVLHTACASFAQSAT